MIQTAVVIFHHQLVFQLRAVHLDIPNSLIQFPKQFLISGISYVIKGPRRKTADHPLTLPDLCQGMHKRVNLTQRKRALQRGRIFILDYFRVRDAMSRQIFIKFLFSHIGADNAIGDVFHCLKIFIGKRAAPRHRDRAKGIAVCQICVSVNLRSFLGILGGPHQIHFSVSQHLQSFVPAAARHILHRPVYIIAQILQIFHIHTGIASVMQRLVIAVHRKEADAHCTLVGPVNYIRSSRPKGKYKQQRRQRCCRGPCPSLATSSKSHPHISCLSILADTVLRMHLSARNILPGPCPVPGHGPPPPR